MMSYPAPETSSEQSRFAVAAIKELMQHGGWTQRELASFLGRSQTHVWATLTGRREITDEEIEIAADMLSAPLDFFYKCTALVVWPDSYLLRPRA
jgi:transcriptional regulator with XRE-family HTH domain